MKVFRPLLIRLWLCEHDFLARHFAKQRASVTCRNRGGPCSRERGSCGRTVPPHNTGESGTGTPNSGRYRCLASWQRQRVMQLVLLLATLVLFTALHILQSHLWNDRMMLDCMCVLLVKHVYLKGFSELGRSRAQ